MRSFLLAFAIVLFCIQNCFASQVILRNNCGGDVQAIWTANGQPSRVACNLGRGQSCMVSLGGAGNFKDGWNGRTLAEFSFNAGGKDWYDISVIVGYDIGMSIQAPYGGFSPSCWYSGCPDAMHFPADTTKIHAVGTGGVFTLTYC